MPTYLQTLASQLLLPLQLCLPRTLLPRHPTHLKAMLSLHPPSLRSPQVYIARRAAARAFVVRRLGTISATTFSMSACLCWGH